VRLIAGTYDSGDVKNTYEEFLLLLLEELKYSPENVMPSSL
jgi:hypothetical protein